MSLRHGLHAVAAASLAALASTACPETLTCQDDTDCPATDGYQCGPNMYREVACYGSHCHYWCSQ